MNINQTSRFQTILKWFVPIAAAFAFAAWMYISPEGALGKLDAIGYAVCHRIDARSFQIGDRQLPLCARCTGEFYAAGLALIFQIFISGKRSKLPSRGIIAVLVLFFLAFGIDGSNSYLYLLKQTSPDVLDKIPNLYIPNNVLRLFTGSGMGIALAAVLYPVVNQTLWREIDERSALEWKPFGILIASVIIINFLILTDSPIVLYPIAYISSLGTLSLLVIVFAILWIIIMRQDNLFDHSRQLWLPLLSGFTLAMLMILSIDLLRLHFTGTWSGFPGLFRVNKKRREEMEILLGVFSAFGLSASAGLNAYIPLLVIGVIGHYFPNTLALSKPWDLIANPWILILLGILVIIEMVADKVPAVNHINDLIQTIIRPVAGAIAFAASAHVVTNIHPVLALACGLLMAGTVHVAKAAALRPAVTATTAGAGNVPVSIAEDVVAFGASLLAVLLPIVMGTLIIILLALVLWWLWRRTDKAQTA